MLIVCLIITAFARLCGVATVLIATYNVKNLFLCGEGAAKPSAELRPLLRMLAQVNADLVVLQEIGSLASLQALNAQLAHPYAQVQLRPGNSDRSIHLGVLSRYPVELTSHRETRLYDEQGAVLQDFANAHAAAAGHLTEQKFCRDLLRIDVHGLPVSLSVFAVHLKSRTNRPWRVLPADTLRAAECRALRDVMQAFMRSHPATLVALCGDFNDQLSSPALQPLTSLGLADPLGEMLQRSGRNPSTYWPKRRMRIDHILVNGPMLTHVVVDSPQIHANRMAQTASDHFPVSLALDVAPSDA